MHSAFEPVLDSGGSDSPGTLRDSLRRATADSHAHAEAVISTLMFRQPIDRATYVNLLRHLLSFISHWERAVESFIEPVLENLVRARTKLPLLRTDLAALGADDTMGAAYPQALPPLDGVGSALGSIYVIEGSTLGGQIIAKRIRQTLSLPDGAGVAYFESYGSQTSARWSEFLDILEQHLTPPLLPYAIEAARATFQAMEGVYTAGMVSASVEKRIC